MHRIPLIIYPHLPLMSLATKQKKTKTAWWSLCMTWTILVVFTWAANGFAGFFQISEAFFTGDLSSVREIGGSTHMVPIITATSVILIPIIIAISPILGKHASSQVNGTLRRASTKRLFAVVITTLLCEELLFRFPLLGLMTKIPKLDGNGSFYLFSLVGSVLFAWVHLMVNFSNKQDRKWIMVLPQFIGGIFLTMIYASHGFFAALGAHAIYDMVLFCAKKRMRFSFSRFVLGFYHLFFLGVYSLLFFGVRNHSLSDIKLAVENEIPNWGFIDYFSLVGVLAASTFFALELLSYDLEVEHSRKVYLLNLTYTGLLMAVTYPAVQLINSHLPEKLLIITVGIALFITFLEKSRSLSGVARLFWKSMLLTFVIQIMQGAEWRTAFFVLLLFLLHQLGERGIRLIGPLWYFIIFLDFYGDLFYDTWRSLQAAKKVRLRNIVPIAGELLERWKVVLTVEKEKGQPLFKIH